MAMVLVWLEVEYQEVEGDEPCLVTILTDTSRTISNLRVMRVTVTLDCGR